MVMSGLFTDLSRLHICRIIIRAGATGTASNLAIVNIKVIINLTAQSYHPESCSTQLVEGLLEGAVLQEVPGGVSVTIQTPVWISTLVESVL